MDILGYQEIMKQVFLNPDNLPAALLDLENNIRTDLAERDAHKTELETSNKRIQELQTVNQQLFLRVTNAQPENNDAPKPDEAINNILEKGFGINAD